MRERVYNSILEKRAGDEHRDWCGWDQIENGKEISCSCLHCSPRPFLLPESFLKTSQPPNHRISQPLPGLPHSSHSILPPCPWSTPDFQFTSSSTSHRNFIRNTNWDNLAWRASFFTSKSPTPSPEPHLQWGSNRIIFERLHQRSRLWRRGNEDRLQDQVPFQLRCTEVLGRVKKDKVCSVEASLHFSLWLYEDLEFQCVVWFSNFTGYVHNCISLVSSQLKCNDVCNQSSLSFTLECEDSSLSEEGVVSM